ncbi:DUF488 family protein [Rhodobacteraceae bacterium F11138]|nr:DUF488 family protein [Rhodobacteraceae bacterium F11138]
MTGTGPIHLARVYDAPDSTVGGRLLVDRLWPRGVAKADLPLDGWPKDIAPSDDLRRWYHEHPARWSDFKSSYLAELDAAPDAVQEVVDRCCAGPVTLLTAVRDPGHSHASILQDYVLRKMNTREGCR